jgi:hypothetical protein
VSDIDTAAADSLKVLDPNRPIREADISWPHSTTPVGAGTSSPSAHDGLEVSKRSLACNQPLQNSNQYLLTHLSAGRFAHEQHLLHLLFPLAWVEISEGQSDK